MNQERLYKIILSPYLSEKASRATQDHGTYVFKVIKDADTTEIKLAVEAMFKTKVKKVRVLNVATKPKRFGAIQGRSKAWKKAYVTLQPGQEIQMGDKA